MSPADQPQAIDWRRSTDPPTLWLSLALGSVLIHLVAFIIISVTLTRTAKVELDPDPIAVEFVDPNTNLVQARSAAPSQVIAARPSQPALNVPANPQAPLTTQIPQASVEPKRSIEQPIVPLQPVKRKPILTRPQQPQPLKTSVPSQPSSAANPTQPQPNPFRTLFPQQPNTPETIPSQPAPAENPAQTGLPGSPSNPPNNPEPQQIGTQAPVESGTKIVPQPGGSSVSVVLSNPRQSDFDLQQQPAIPKESNKKVSITYSGAITQRRDRPLSIEVTLTIDSQGSVIGFGKTSLLSSDVNIPQEDLDTIAKQIFEPWTFEPAYDRSSGSNSPAKPPLSNLTVKAEIQFL